MNGYSTAHSASARGSGLGDGPLGRSTRGERGRGVEHFYDSSAASEPVGDAIYQDTFRRAGPHRGGGYHFTRP